MQESVGIATGFLLAALHMSGLATLTHTPESHGISDQHSRPAEERAAVCPDPGRPFRRGRNRSRDHAKRVIAEVMNIA